MPQSTNATATPTPQFKRRATWVMAAFGLTAGWAWTHSAQVPAGPAGEKAPAQARPADGRLAAHTNRPAQKPLTAQPVTVAAQVTAPTPEPGEHLAQLATNWGGATLGAEAQAEAPSPALAATAAEAPLSHAQWLAAAQMPPPHLPVLQVTAVAEPPDIDATGLSSSAYQAPTTVRDIARGATIIGQGGTGSPRQAAADEGLGAVRAAAATSASVVYTPAQVRQAYGLSTLPAATTANRGAYQGSGQTIVIIDAFHNAAAGANLNVFAAKFGLPTCTLLPNTYKAGATLAAMVPAAKPGEGCVFQTVYVTADGNVGPTPPPVNAGWTTEIDLDVQWAHAIAPMAKIVLVEAASNSGLAIVNAMKLASKLGAATISMSYGSTESSSTPTLDPVLTGPSTWVASSGDSGAIVEWPAVSVNALAVGGTQLTSVSPRAELAWSGSGGGRSLYEPMPAWQGSVSIAGNPVNSAANASKMRRGVPDVAYNASPNSGFYIYENGSWFSVGGTSAGAPQWAALTAVTASVRALNGKAPLSGTAFQQAVYSVAANATNYRATFLDIVSGSNGGCATCKAGTNYDLVTGLGSPNVPTLLSSLTALK